MALNDLVFASRQLKAADPRDGPEASEFFRLTCLHLWELSKFLSETTRDWPEVTAFVGSLPAPARQEMETVIGVGASDALAEGARLLVTTRDLRAHYQSMDPQKSTKPRDPVARALAALASEEMTLEVASTVEGLRLAYADAVLAHVMLTALPDADKASVVDSIATANGAAVQFIQRALDAWFKTHPSALEKLP